MLYRIVAVLLITAIGLVGCASRKPQTERTAEFYLKEGEAHFERGAYDQAIESWQKVREIFYSPELNVIAELNIAEAYFAGERYVEAVAAYEDFLRERPDHVRTPDVLYNLGLSYYRQILTIDRDQTATRNALATFEMLTTKFPRDPRTPEVRELIMESRDRLAASELYVGRFYFRTGRYQAAINRLTRLFEDYPSFAEQDKAWFYLGCSLLASGQTDEAGLAFNKLFEHFPDSEYVPRARKSIARGR